jgi:hypothetical protein
MKVKIFKGWSDVILQEEINNFLIYISKITSVVQSQLDGCITISIFL